jgi:hypothetical protein
VTKRSQNKLGYLAVIAGVATAAGLLFLVNEKKESNQEGTAAVQVELEEKAPDKINIVRNNFKTIHKMEDNRKVRDSVFRMEKGMMKAEGIELKKPGEMVFTSQVTGTSLSQKILSASLHDGEGKSNTIAQSDDPAVQTSKRNDKSHLRYLGFFEGIDLEYTYDGKDVEEFFHLSDKLRNTIIKEKVDLKIKAEFPGLSVEDGAMLSTTEGTPLELVTDPTTDTTVPGAAKNELFSHDTVELGLRGDRFVLPAAVVEDAAGNKLDLERSFAWKKSGLVAELTLPYEWVKNAEPPIVIDPSILDDSASAYSNTWNETSFVRDSLPLPDQANPGNQGRFHYGWRAYYNGKWTAMYTSGTGSTWDTPTPIASMGNGEHYHYVPNIAIDSNDTLHAFWADYGDSNESNKDIRGDHPGNRHRLHYAQCPNRCVLKNWNFNGTAGGVIVSASNLGHQLSESMAVDQNNVVHLAFEQRDPYMTRYFQVSGGVITEKMQPGQTYHSTFLVVDGANTLHYIGTDYWNQRDTKHYVWDPAGNAGQGAWSAKARMNVKQFDISCDTTEPLHRGHAVAKGIHIHLVGQMRTRYCSSGRDTWAVWYGRYDINADTWTGVCPPPSEYNNVDHQDRPCVIRKPPSYDPRKHDQDPMVTVDNDDVVHVVWLHEADPQKQIMYSTLSNAANSTLSGRFTTPIIFLNTAGSYQKPQLRPRLVQPVGPNNSVPPNLLDLVVIENGVEIRYVSTAEPLEGAQPTTPPDHTYTSDSTPTFNWSRLASDDGANTKYVIQVSTTPLFTTVTVTNSSTANYGDAPSFTTPTALADGSYYYWRVQAENQHGTGPWGPIYELGIDTSPPGAFSLTGPADGTDPGTKTPEFTWTQAAD